MSIHVTQLEQLVKETLEELSLYTDGKIPYTAQALDLLMMTCAHESHLGHYLKQMNGPALGIFQMEPLTHEDHWEYIGDRNWLFGAFCKMNLECETRPANLEWNLRYAIVMTRVHYYRKPEALPKRLKQYGSVHWESMEDYIEALGDYAKQHYNTALGKATSLQYQEDYKTYVLLK